MPSSKKKSRVVDFEARVRERAPDKYILRLYIAGTTPRSTRAVANIREICERNLNGRYDLEVIDIYQKPALAIGEQIIAAPTLVKQLPLPLRRFIGDLSDTERILVGIDLAAAS
jgi:circadian clock protein KaiB